MATRKTAQSSSRSAGKSGAQDGRSTGKSSTASREGKQTARTQRELQQEAEEKKKASSGGGKAKKQPVQAGARKQPTNPMPAQHLDKPGHEHELDLQPRYLAPDYKGSGKLEGMAAIVTGGDSGIGRSVAVLFAREGCDVAVLHLSEHEDADKTREVVEAEGARCIVIAGDVKDTKFCEKAVKQTVKAFGRLDVLVNNAAFQQHASRLEDISDAQWDETLRTNIGGYFRMARAALPHMKEGGSIVNTGSEVALLGSPQLLDYSSSKGAIHAFTLSLAGNLLDRGIRVNAVAPGPVWTPLNPADRPADKVADFGKQSEMRRPAQPEEMAPAYVFLASPVCSGYINGVILPAMGGPRG
jgi:NAD(P)-dependent dehydrogenase (short-subunit alcohol dehydrogenase family)